MADDKEPSETTGGGPKFTLQGGKLVLVTRADAQQAEPGVGAKHPTLAELRTMSPEEGAAAFAPIREAVKALTDGTSNLAADLASQLKGFTVNPLPTRWDFPLGRQMAEFNRQMEETQKAIAQARREKIEREIESVRLQREQVAQLRTLHERLEDAERRHEAAQAESQRRLAALEEEVRRLKRPGRPTPWHLVVEEFDRRVATGRVGVTAIDAARGLETWLRETHGKTMTAAAIARRLGRERKSILDGLMGSSDARRKARRRRS